MSFSLFQPDKKSVKVVKNPIQAPDENFPSIHLFGTQCSTVAHF